MLQLIVVLAALFHSTPSPAHTEAETRCSAPFGTEVLLEEAAGRVLVVGELHGTNEAPAFAASLICLALDGSDSVVLGLEMSADEQPALDAYLASDGGPAARAALVSGDPWTYERQDGRRSRAMVRLIDGVRGWRAAGLPVEAVALDFGEADLDLYDAHGGATVRDRSMLRRALAAQQDADRVIVLVGNVHARRIALEYGDQRIETLGTLSEPDVLALVGTSYGAGEAWNCRSVEGESSCTAHPVRSASVDGPPRVLSSSEADGLDGPLAYDYVAYLGHATVSPPVSGAD